MINEVESNGHVYAYILNEDETVVQIADIDAKLGGAMALDYDTYEGVLWVAADDGSGNRMARITLNGSSGPEIVHVLPASGVDAAANNEGFAIADAAYTVNGQRPVYRFCDGVVSGALMIGSINCGYSAAETPDPGAPADPSKPAEDPKPSDPTKPNEPIKPSDPAGKPTSPSGKPAAPSADKKPTNAPKTGDSGTLWVWAVLAVLSAGACFGVILIHPREKQKQ